MAGRAILIAGPTASGKSALALAVARRLGGLVINADSMQVYRELRILTARPTPAEEAEVPHRLYGHASGAQPYSTGHWIADVGAALAEARRLGRRPVVVGGTGLYFKALLEGLSPIPAVPHEIRRRWRAEAIRLGPAALHALLAGCDPPTAARLQPTDPQRVTRALEVLEATGRSLAHWQALPREPLLAEAATVRIVLLPDRALLNARCDTRFDHMMAAGALAEVAALAALGLERDWPVMRALGVPPLLEHRAGRASLSDAVERAKRETRYYVKRQRTWLRGNMLSWISITTQFYDEMERTAFAIIRGND